MSKFLITGGAGFIGGNFCHYMVNTYPEDEFVCIITHPPLIKMLTNVTISSTMMVA